MTTHVLLRPAQAADAPAIARLLGQLGYPQSVEDVASRLPQVVAGGACVTLAESGGAVVGLSVGEIGIALNRPGPVARLALLVTDESVRGQGIGRQLVAAFEAWAVAQGAGRATLTSALHREAAHGFYRACGWEATGLRFARDLSLPG